LRHLVENAGYFQMPRGGDRGQRPVIILIAILFSTPPHLFSFDNGVISP
jgi:hypothetical protein